MAGGLNSTGLLGSDIMKLSRKKIKNFSPSKIGKMKVPELREFVRGARNLFNQQMKTFSQYSDKLYSPALDKMEQFYDENKRAPSKMKLSELRKEAFKLKDFFSSETSTVPGARKIQREQDIAIFGADKRGRPKHRMAPDERSKFWSLYDEYKRMRPSDIFEASGFVQQMLGQMMLENSMLDFNSKTFADLEFRIRDAMRIKWEEENWEMIDSYERMDDIFSGKKFD